MLPLPLKALLRLYRAHPWLLLMSLVGLTLGVSLVVAIELLNHSARTNFVAARSQLAGEANYRLAPDGGLDEQLYVTLVRSQPNFDAMPQLHGWLQDEQGRSFQLLGMDGSVQPRPLAPAVWRRTGPRAHLLSHPRRQRLAGRPRGQAPWLANGPEPALRAGGR